MEVNAAANVINANFIVISVNDVSGIYREFYTRP